jgi:hypothetical protein
LELPATTLVTIFDYLLTHVPRSGSHCAEQGVSKKMKSANYILSLLVAGTAFGASPVVFDNFNTFSGSTGFNLSTLSTPVSDGPDLLPSSDETLVGDVTRLVAVSRTAGGASANNAFGNLDFANTTTGLGTLSIAYTLSAPTDLTVGNAFSFVLVSTELAAQINYSISVSDGVNTSTTPVSNLPIVLGVFNVPFAAFTLGTGADFDSITSINLQLTAALAGSDAAIDAFGLNLPPPPEVPEASTYAAVGFMSLVAFGAYRRNRK